MAAFPGIASYQEYCRMAVMEDGYILLNPITKHKAFIYDFEELKAIQEKLGTEDFWSYYSHLKKEAPNSDTSAQYLNYKCSMVMI